MNLAASVGTCVLLPCSFIGTLIFVELGRLWFDTVPPSGTGVTCFCSDTLRMFDVVLWNATNSTTLASVVSVTRARA